MCTNAIGKADAMSPQEQLRYKEAMGGLEIPTDTPVVTRNDSYVKPKGATVKLPDGRMITQDAYNKLQDKLKNRKV